LPEGCGPKGLLELGFGTEIDKPGPEKWDPGASGMLDLGYIGFELAANPGTVLGFAAEEEGAKLALAGVPALELGFDEFLNGTGPDGRLKLGLRKGPDPCMDPYLELSACCCAGAGMLGLLNRRGPEAA